MAVVRAVRQSASGDMPEPEKLALLTLKRSDASRDCVAAMRKARIGATEKDYATLLMTRMDCQAAGAQRLDLTPRGRLHADWIAADVARRYGLHHFTSGGGRFDFWIRCTCGWSASQSRNEGHVAAALNRYAAGHLAKVENEQPQAIADAIELIDKALLPPEEEVKVS